ncbi:MAG: GNAT family N-acetyltransferase [Actinomycetota bacterium]|nr:GNAT family N-acetyltransferase [Actinomycetota bacterium]
MSTAAHEEPVTLPGRRVQLRPLAPEDFSEWQAVRLRSHAWLTPWEPRRPPGSPDVIRSRSAFAARCKARDRERQLGAGYGFGIFVGGRLCGEINLNGIQRGPFQNAYVGYWIDAAHAGNGYVPEALVVLARFAFDDLNLHRLQVAIVPRNRPSRRVVEKLGLRCEGTAERYLEINGVWEDHLRFAITAEEWHERRGELLSQWVAGTSS